jgi:hypothetical protein
LSVDYNVTVLTDRLQLVANAIDIGGGGVMRLLDSGGNVLSSMLFFVPCGIAAGGVLTFATPLVDASVTMGGTAIGARCEDANGTVVISGLAVNTSSSPDIILAGQTVAILAASITGN